MTDPVRLLASSEATDLERELLGSWKDERPSAVARDKTLAMLGVAGGAAGAAAAGGSIAPKALAAGWAVLAKWMLLGAVAVGTVTGVGVAVRRHARGPDVAATLQPLAAPKAAAPAHATEAPPETVALPTTAPARHARGHAAAPAASSIQQQVAALDRARGALEQGDPARARKLVAAYETAYPGGAFLQEAELLRIEAFAREGKKSEAERMGKHFLATYPNSPHDARVRALLGYDSEE